MDAQAQFQEVLETLRQQLPASVMATCESMNAHGEWELAMSHCLHHLKESGAAVSEHAATLLLLAACSERFQRESKAKKVDQQWGQTQRGNRPP